MAVSTRVYKRNIVIVGKTGSGKSSVANKILGRDEFNVCHGQNSSIEGHKLCTSKIYGYPAEFDLKVVDTKGLFDTNGKLNIGKELYNIKEFLQTNISEGVNMVLFVRKKDRFTRQERETFDCMIKYFKEFQGICGLIITGCECDNDVSRHKIIKDFKENEETEKIAAFMTQGIHVVGFPDISQSPEVLRSIFQEGNKKDAEALRKSLFIRQDIELKPIPDNTFWETVRQRCR